MVVTGATSRCTMCGEFFDSKRQLREHIDRHHRITNSKMKARGRRKEEWLTTIKEEEEQKRQLEEGIAKKTRKKKREKWLFLFFYFLFSPLMTEASSLRSVNPWWYNIRESILTSSGFRFLL
jgi:hypothetical protein